MAQHQAVSQRELLYDANHACCDCTESRTNYSITRIGISYCFPRPLDCCSKWHYHMGDLLLHHTSSASWSYFSNLTCKTLKKDSPGRQSKMPAASLIRSLLFSLNDVVVHFQHAKTPLMYSGTANIRIAGGGPIELSYTTFRLILLQPPHANFPDGLSSFQS